MDFAIFDWLDHDGRPLGEQLADHVRMVEAADDLGCVGYHLAEHHGTPLGIVSSPNLFLAALATRTRRIRLGAMVNVLPLYHPVRLAEEICLLDHLSAGRLDLGVGRGGAPPELAVYGVSREEAHERYDLVFKTLLRALVGGESRTGDTPEGLGRGPIFQRPLQRPYPPLWYPTSNLETVPWLGAEGINTLFSSFLLDRVGVSPARAVRTYAENWVVTRERPGRLNEHVVEPRVGVIRHVVVADDDGLADALAEPALDRFFDSFNKLWIQAGLPPYFSYDYSSFKNKRHVVVGSPQRVRATMHELMAVEGNYMAGVFAFGGLPMSACLRSLTLFAEEVAPSVATVSLEARAE